MRAVVQVLDRSSQSLLSRPNLFLGSGSCVHRFLRGRLVGLPVISFYSVLFACAFHKTGVYLPCPHLVFEIISLYLLELLHRILMSISRC